MKRFLACLAVFSSAVVYAQITGDTQRKWTDSFADLKANIRTLDQSSKKDCEDHLRQILKSLDSGASCSVDTECTILNQDPFGATVPIRVNESKALLTQMKQFADSCDNHSFHSIANNGTVSVPACIKRRCMVVTSLSQQH